jgi:hypothetical protein
VGAQANLGPVTKIKVNAASVHGTQVTLFLEREKAKTTKGEAKTSLRQLQTRVHGWRNARFDELVSIMVAA